MEVRGKGLERKPALVCVMFLLSFLVSNSHAEFCLANAEHAHTLRTYSRTGSFLGVTAFVEPYTSIADSNFNIGHLEARSEFLWYTGEDTPLETDKQTMCEHSYCPYSARAAARWRKREWDDKYSNVRKKRNKE